MSEIWSSYQFCCIKINGFSPIDTVTSHGLLLLWNCFLDFAVEHWFGCHATELDFAGDIGAIEVWLIDWLNRSYKKLTEFGKVLWKGLSRSVQAKYVIS